MADPVKSYKPDKSAVYVFIASVFLTVFNPILGDYSYLDEFLVLLLIIQCHKQISYFRKINEIKLLIWVFLFYLVYSLLIKNNVVIAIFRDALIFTKPFVCFYSAFVMGCNLSKNERLRYKKIMKFLGILLWAEAPFIEYFHPNTTGFYPGCAYTSIGYLLFSNFTKKDIAMASIILLPGLLSIRAKFFAEVILWFVIWYTIKNKVKLNLKYIILGALTITAIYYVNSEKILLYFVNGVDEGAARSMMYVTAMQMFIDYFPFGSGFGTFATDSAAKYYSPINYKYGLDRIWGLNPDDSVMGTEFYSDTFYPILAQFGVIGAGLFFWFLKRKWDEAKHLSLKRYKLFLFVFSYLLVQCIAENTFTGANGLPILLMLGFMLSRKYKYY